MSAMKFLYLLYLLITAPFYVFAHTQNPSELEMGPAVRYDAPQKGTASIIFLHGLGTSAEIFAPLVQRFYQDKRFWHINLILPNAPIRANLVEFGGHPPSNPVARSWFNISAAGLEGGYDEDQYWQISDYIEELVLNETAHGIPLNRIVVGGFSQGGMVSLGALASIHTKVAGWLFFPTEIPQNLTRFDRNLVYVNKHTPIFAAHGLNDTIIPVQEGIRTANLFKGLGFDYNLKLYPNMTHQPDWEPHDRDAANWVAKILPKKWHR